MALPILGTRHLFFTGKGGVGKTTLSCATAIALAESGRRVLVVSTDPASNLDEVLAVALSSSPTPVLGVSGLFALNIDPEAAAREYRERMVAPYRSVLPAAAIQSIEEQFSGACTVEIAAFNEFATLIGDPYKTEPFDHIIFDTAPTGHTLRLLTLPSAWNGFIESSSNGASCLGPLAGLEKQRAVYAQAVAKLADAAQTTIILVSRPDAAALREAERTRAELAELGIANQVLAINGWFKHAAPGDAVADAMARRAEQAMADLPQNLALLSRFVTPFASKGLLGVEALRTLSALEENPVSLPAGRFDLSGLPVLPNLSPLLKALAQNGQGVVMVMGKGGVGKTTVAAAMAMALAKLGHDVLLSTTDPAAHIAAAVETPMPNLSVSRINPEAEVERYRREVLEKAGKDLDAQGRALLEEDLRSPCTEEIAVFRAFAKTVEAGKAGFVVLDTAPTGHTILLLDAAEAYHHEVLRIRGDMPESVRELLPRLRDPGFTHVIITTLAEATPVHEAERLQQDLARAGIQPFAWVINQSLFASGTADPLLAERGRQEIPFIRRVAEELAPRCALIPWLPKPPIGSLGLAQLFETLP